MRIVLTGGGTGGHLIPFEPIVEALRAWHVAHNNSLPGWLDPETLDLQFLGVSDENTKAFFASYDVPSLHIPSGKLRRYMSHLTVIDLLFRLPWGIMLALFHVWRVMPDVVLSKGGYGSLPVVLAAFFYRIPVLVHESDAVPGLANTLLARLAAVVAVGFPQSRQAFASRIKKTVVTGIPVRHRFSTMDPAAAKRSLGLRENDTVLLVIGGSLGAQQINELVLKTLPWLLTYASVLHVTGRKNYDTITTLAKEVMGSERTHTYKAFPYLEERIAEAFAAADVVVSRAGATTLAELARMRKATLLVPLGSAANDHQRHNATLFEQAGAARVLDPSNLGVNLFKRNIEDLLTNETLRTSLAKGMADMDQPDAAKRVAELAFTLAKGLIPEFPA